MKTLPAHAVLAMWLFLSPLALAQSETPVSVVQKRPARTELKIGGTSYGQLLTWRITDIASSHYGLTLVWLEIRESKSRVSVEKTNGQAIRSTPVDATTLALLSGGTWTGRYDSPNSAKRGSGLVIASGTPVSAFTARTGGVFVACANDLRFFTASDYASKYGTRLPCEKASVLQTSTMLIRDGKAEPFPAGEKANRLAIGQDEDQIIIAGAFTSFGTALSLADFSAYLAAAGKKLGRNDLTALNLDGACSAQLFIPPLNRRFGCETAGFNINRIAVRR